MNIKVAGISFLLLLLCIILAVTVPESFLKGNNIENLLRRTAMYGVLGIGVAFVIITAGIDLSIGSMVCLIGCLFALFLKVDYKPFDEQSVLEVKAAEKKIVLPGETDFKTGDMLRYYGGRRARTAMFQITDVVTSGANTELSLSESPSRDDSVGSVAQAYAVANFENQQGEKLASVEIKGAHTELAARDKVWFVHTDSGLKNLTVASTQVKSDTKLQLESDFGSLDSQWVAIPLERRQRMSVATALLCVLGISLALGLLHGLLVTKLKLQPFVVTLCGLLFYRGISRWIVNDQTMGFGNEYDDSISPLGAGKLLLWQSIDGTDSFGIPYPFFILLITALLAAIFLNKTIWGRYMLALGRNEEAARYSGINTDRVTMVAYVICTLTAAIGGILFALDSNSVAPSSFGNFFELYAIAAAVLGGCSLRGGEGGILGVVIGTALMQTLYNLIVLLKISDTLEFAIIGAVILAGVIADELVKRIASKSRATSK